LIGKRNYLKNQISSMKKANDFINRRIQYLSDQRYELNRLENMRRNMSSRQYYRIINQRKDRGLPATFTEIADEERQMENDLNLLEVNMMEIPSLSHELNDTEWKIYNLRRRLPNAQQTRGQQDQYYYYSCNQQQQQQELASTTTSLLLKFRDEEDTCFVSANN
jgi:hypothetical protein